MPSGCFVIMPFRPELHYFYLYLKKHLHDHYQLECTRADDLTSTIPFFDKIKAAIEGADVIIAECTGVNPNVFYELGIAHAQGKHVILLMQAGKEFSTNDIPSDVRHYDFILYQIEKDAEFFEQLDRALQSYLNRYELLYKRACALFERFRQTTKLSINIESEATFTAQLKLEAETESLPSPYATDDDLALFLLPIIIMDGNDPITLSEIARWIR